MRGIIFAASLPGPKNGQTLCTKAIFEKAQQKFGFTEVFHFAIVSNWSRNKIINALVKVATTLFSAIRLRFVPIRGIYYCPNARWGKLMDICFFIVAPRNRDYFLHHHSGGYIKRPTSMSRFVFKLLPSRVNHIVSCDFFASALKKHYNVQGEVYVVPCTFMCKPDLNSSPADSPIKQWKFGHLSNLTMEKGLGEIMEVAKRICNLETNCEVLVAGPVADSKVRQLKEQSSHDSLPIKWLNSVFDGEKNDFFSELSLFLFPSKYHDETWGIVVSEARSRGIPCLVSDLPGVRDQVNPEFVWSATRNDENFAEFVERHLFVFVSDNSKYFATRNAVLEEFTTEYNESLKQLDVVLEAIYRASK